MGLSAQQFLQPREGLVFGGRMLQGECLLFRDQLRNYQKTYGSGVLAWDRLSVYATVKLTMFLPRTVTFPTKLDYYNIVYILYIVLYRILCIFYHMVIKHSPELNGSPKI